MVISQEGSMEVRVEEKSAPKEIHKTKPKKVG
jgi:hypothetical protein